MTKETTRTQLNIEDLTRRQIRYICFRLQTEAGGGSAAASEEQGIMQYVDLVKKHIESQDDFGGWKMFAKTWDVDEKSPLVVVKRTSSIYSDWNNVMKKEAKDLPVTPQTTKIVELPASDVKKSSPVRDSSGKFVKKTTLLANKEESSKKKSFWDKLS